ncbi:MAG: hypothetical protein L6R41_002176 [Letrouitia leprolyta]|nr:MAG: hypothetical protein L6R41_002176 [Letrouitia leprolyta]
MAECSRKIKAASLVDRKNEFTTPSDDWRALNAGMCVVEIVREPSKETGAYVRAWWKREEFEEAQTAHSSHGEPARGLPGFAANSSPSGNVGVTKECGQPANAEALDQDSTSPGAPNDMTEDVKPNGNSNKYEEANTLEDCYPIIEFEDFWNEEADLVNNRTESDSDHASHISNYGTSPESCGAQNDTEYGIDTEINEFFGGACTTEDEAREEAGSTVSERYEVNMPYKECAVETKATSRMTIQFESGLLKSPEKTLIPTQTVEETPSEGMAGKIEPTPRLQATETPAFDTPTSINPCQPVDNEEPSIQERTNIREFHSFDDANRMLATEDEFLVVQDSVLTATLTELKAKITTLEGEKAEGEKMVFMLEGQKEAVKKKIAQLETELKEMHTDYAQYKAAS